MDTTARDLAAAINRAAKPATVALLPEYLAEDFSAENVRTQCAVKALYETLLRHAQSPSLEAIFDRWAQVFAEVTDYEHWKTKLSNETELRKMLKAFGIPQDTLDLSGFFFATHTFFAILTKLLAYIVVGHYTDLPTPPLAEWNQLTNDQLADHFGQLESGGPFRAGGIRNFLEGDFFAWYAKYFTPELASCLRAVVARFATYDPATLDLAPGTTQDMLKKLYHRLVSPHIRKALGEYYTPDWLALRVLNLLEGGKFRGDPGTRLLDPTCGSGTFLLMAMNAIRANSLAQSMDDGELLRKICRNVVGIDLNPLAVIAARTNYLLALGPLLKSRGKDLLEIPIYLADSVMMPSRKDHDFFSAPVFLAPFDYVAGNPPWIGWENLPEGYRHEIKELWQQHGLFVHSGMDTILGKGKKDISMLVTYVAADSYLKEGGKLGFVINQAVFKMAGAAQGFRRFKTRRMIPLHCFYVDDFSELQLFEGATNKTAVFIMRKGEPQKYPVSYTSWSKKEPGRKGSFGYDDTLDDVMSKTERSNWTAEPADDKDPTSAWLTGNGWVVKTVKKILGCSVYEGHLGVNAGGGSAVYFFELLGKPDADGMVQVRNLVENAKRKVESVQTKLEARFLHPLLKGQNVDAWRPKPSAYLLFVQDPKTRRGISRETLKGTQVLKWLERHETLLRQRAAYQRYYDPERDPFWSMFDVGDYTLLPWKVVWSRIAWKLEAAVVSKVKGQLVLPQETFTYIGLRDKTEAYYVCGVVNSTPFRLAVSCFSQPGSKSFGTPSILEKARIPKFDPASKLHQAIAAEALRLSGETPDAVEPVHPALNALCKDLWRITDQELNAVEAAYRDLYV